MNRKILSILITPLVAPCVQAQHILITGSDSEGARWTSEKLAEHICNGEQMTIAQVSKRAPMVETYVQSLDPEKNPEGSSTMPISWAEPRLIPIPASEAVCSCLRPRRRKARL